MWRVPFKNLNSLVQIVDEKFHFNSFDRIWQLLPYKQKYTARNLSKRKQEISQTQNIKANKSKSIQGKIVPEEKSKKIN